MRCISVHSVNQALSEGLRHLEYFGVRQDSRNGEVIASPVPVATHYKDPTARVLFSPLRDANPYFHFMEALWMLAGRNDVAFLTKFNKQMRHYSDDGHTQHGAYGYRWRTHFKLDQLELIIEELQNDPTSRRAVLAMWDPGAEWSAVAAFFDKGGAKDLPCNTHVYFGIANNKLNMTVCCRSNDLWWGAYGANAVHFSILQEYVASAVGAAVGDYYQISNNFHVYPANLPEDKTLEELADSARHNDYYVGSYYTGEADRAHFPKTKPLETARFPLIHHDHHSFDRNLELFMGDNPHEGIYSEPIFSEVAEPMLSSWEAYKNKDYAGAEVAALNINAWDWRTACLEWLDRRRTAREAKVRQGVG